MKEKVIVIITNHIGFNELYFNECVKSVEKAIQNTTKLQVEYKVITAHKCWKSRNEGLIYAIKNGFDYYMNIDYDDYIKRDYINNLYERYLDTNSDIIYTAYNHSNDNYKAVPREGLTLDQIRMYNGLSSFVFAKPETILGIGGYTADDDVSEDWIFNYQAAKNGLTYSVNFKGGYIYRIHSEQVTKSLGWSTKLHHTQKYLI